MLFYIMSGTDSDANTKISAGMNVDPDFVDDSGSDKSDESDESGSGIRYSTVKEKEKEKKGTVKSIKPDMKFKVQSIRKKRLSEVYLNKDFESKLLPYQYKYLNEVIKTCNLSEIEKEAIVEAKDMAEELDRFTDKEFDDLMKDLSISKGGNLNKQKGGTDFAVVFYLSFLLLMGKNAHKAIHFLLKLGKDYLMQWFKYFNDVTDCFQQLYRTTMVRVYPEVLEFIQMNQQIINENVPILRKVYLFLLNNVPIYFDHIISTLSAFEEKLNEIIYEYNRRKMANQYGELQKYFSTLKKVVEAKKEEELAELAELQNKSTTTEMEFSEKIVESAQTIQHLAKQLEILQNELETLKNSEDTLKKNKDTIKEMMVELKILRESIQSISSSNIGGGKKSHRTKKHHKKKSRRTKSKKKRSQAARRKKKM